MRAEYLFMNLVFLVLLAILDVFVLKSRAITQAKTWKVVGILLILTAIFDNAIVGFGIVTYDPESILGIKIWYAPIEDFFYAVAAPIVVSSFIQFYEKTTKNS